MMLSYMLSESGAETLVICLDEPDVVHLITGQDIELPLSDLSRAIPDKDTDHLKRVTVLLLGPGAAETLLGAAEEAEGRGTDVRIANVQHPGGPVDET